MQGVTKSKRSRDDNKRTELKETQWWPLTFKFYKIVVDMKLEDSSTSKKYGRKNY